MNTTLTFHIKAYIFTGHDFILIFYIHRYFDYFFWYINTLFAFIYVISTSQPEFKFNQTLLYCFYIVFALSVIYWVSIIEIQKDN